MERKEPSLFKSTEPKHSSRNVEGTSRRKESCKGKSLKRVYTSEGTSSDELVNADESRIEHAQLYCASSGESSQKEAARKLKTKGIRPSTPKQLKKVDTSKKNVEKSSNSKKIVCKRTVSAHESFSGSSEKHPYQIHSRAFSEDTDRGARKKMERKRPSTSKSTEHDHSSKKNIEGISRRKESCKGKSLKRVYISEGTSSDELVITDESRIENSQLYSSATSGESSRKESARKLETKGIKPSTPKQLKKVNALKKNVEKSSSSKGKVYKRAVSAEESFSGSSEKHPYQIHYRAFSQDNDREARKKMERKRPSTFKSTEKQYYPEKKVEEISQRSQGSRKTAKVINYCEDSPPKESRKHVIPQFCPSFSSIGGYNIHNAVHGSSSKLLIKNKMVKGNNKTSDFEDSSSDNLNPNSGVNDDRPVVGNLLQLSDSKTLPDRRDLSKSGSSSFRFQGKKNDTIRHSKGDEEHKKNGTEVENENWAQKAPLPFEQLSDSETLSDLQDLSNTGSSSPFRFWGKKTDAIRHSKGDEEHKKDGTEVEDGDCVKKAPKQVNKTDVEKAWEKFKARMKNKDKKNEPNTSKIDGAEPGTSSSHHDRKDTFKSTIQMTNVESKKNCAEIVTNDNVKKESEKLKSSRKLEKMKELNSSRIPNAAPGTPSSSHCRWLNAFKPNKPIIHSEGKMEHKKEGTKLEDDVSAKKFPIVVNKDDVEKDWEKCKALREEQLENKTSSSTKINDAEPETFAPFHCQKNEAIKPLKSTFKRSRHSDGEMEHKKDSTKMQNEVCVQNTPILVNSDVVKKDDRKSLQKLEKENELIGSKINDAEIADEVHTDECSNKNIADLKFSPLSAEHKRGLKRLSDPCKVLKENNTPPSI